MELMDKNLLFSTVVCQPQNCRQNTRNLQPPMKRRDFIGAATFGVGAMVFGHPAISSSQNADEVPTADKAHNGNCLAQIQLTKDVQCSRIGMGTGMRGGNRVSDTVRAGWKKSIELINFAYDSGIRLFDCADMYGTHVIVAEALKGKPRDSYTLVSKVWMHPHGGLPEKERLLPEESVKRFLRELRTEYIDVLQIHCMMNANWVEQFAEAMKSMERLKKQGLIRAHGISSHSNAATEAAAKSDWCDVIHTRINSEGMNMDGFKDDVRKRIEEGVRTTKMAHDAGKGIIAMKVLGEGKMSKDAEMRRKSTKFVVDLDCVDVLIAAFDEKEHITEFVKNIIDAERIKASSLIDSPTTRPFMSAPR